MGIFTVRKNTYFIFLFIAVLAGFTKSFAQCPTVLDNTQSFCDIQSPTISSLVATANGNGVVWYATATSTMPLAPGAGLVSGEDYFADDNSGSCGTRQSVTVMVYTKPLGQSFQGPCVENAADATIADLQAVGNNVQWYSSNTSLIPLPSTTILSDNTIYYASQTNPDTGCETSRLAVFVNVGLVPVPTGDATQEFCSDPAGPVPTVGDLVASGNNNWYLTASSAAELDMATPLVDGQSYFATTVDPPCESVSRFEVVVSLQEPNDAGGNGVRQICQNQVASTPPFNLFGLLGGTPDNDGVWTGPLSTTNGFQGTVNVSSLTLAGSPYVFTYTVSSGLCAPDTATVTITILPLPTVAIAANATICSGGSATVTFTGTPGATATYTVNNGPNQTITLNGSGTATINSTYTATTTYTLVSVASTGTPSCTQPQTGSVTITVLPLPIAAISANATICSGGSATVTFTGTPNATVTYTINNSPNQTIVLNGAGTATITGTYLVTTVFNLVSITSAGTPSCSRPLTGTVTITVIQLPTVTLASNVTICPNAQATVTFTGTPNATVTYTVNNGPNQTIVLNAGGTATITNTYTTTTTYTLVSVATQGTPSCGQPQTGSVTITVLPLPVVTISTNVTICSGGSATVGFTGTPNATVVYTVNNGPNQAIVLNGSGLATIVGNYTNTTTFTLVSVTTAGTPNCTRPVTGTMVITVLPLPNVTISSNASVCPNGQATVTFMGTPNATVTYTVNNGPNQTIVLGAGGTATITGTYAVTTIYNLVSITTSGTPACTQPQTGSITITVLPLPVVTISSNATICSGGTATVTFTGTPNASVTYTVNNSPNQTIVLNAGGTATIAGTYTVTTTFTLVSVTASGTPACTQPQTGSVTITVAPLPVVAISSNATICSGSSATVTFTGTPNATVIYTVNNGPNQTIVLNAGGTAAIAANYTATTVYTLVSVATSGTPSCTQLQTGSITITVLPLPVVSIASDVTICSGGNATVTFTGTPNATVTYSINNAPNQTIVLNAGGTAVISGTYTTTTTFTLVNITTSGTPGCTQPATGSVTITVIQQPVVNISGTISVCPNGQATIGFTGTPNATVTYTVNNGPSQTIVLNGSGLATIVSNFTATTTYTLVSVAILGTPTCQAAATGSVVITVLPIPVVSITANATICSGASATVTFTGTPNGTVTYTVNNGPNQTIILDAGGTATITGNYTATTTFTLVSIAAGGCSQPQTGSVIITVLPLPVVSISSNTTICSGDSATVTFTGTPNTTVTYTVNNGTNQTIVLNPGGTATIIGNYTTTTVFALVSVATSGTPACIQPQSGSITITVVPLPVVTISTMAATVCSGTTGTVIFAGTPNATVTYTINNGPNVTVVLNGSGSASLSAVLSATTTYTLVSVATNGSPGCSQAQTESVTITATPPPVAGNDVANVSLCATAAPVNLFALLGNGAQAGGIWSPALASGTGVFNPAVDPSGTYVYTVSGTPPCLPDTASVTVVITPLPDAGNDASVTICSNASPQDLFASLGASAQTGGTWSPALSGGNGLFDPAADPAGTYSYTVTGTAPCGNDTAIVTVQIAPGPDAGLDGTLAVCANSAPQDLFDSLTGTPQAGGAWSPVLASGTGIFNPALDAAGVYTYTFFGNQPCDNDTATVTVTINPIPDAGIDGAAFFCSNYAPSDLFANLGGTPQAGGIWSPALASGTGVFNPSVDVAGVYTYTVGGIFCATDSATVTVTVTQSPDAGGPGLTLTLCVTNTTLDLFTGLDGTQGVGTWADDDASGALAGNVFNPSQAGAGTFHFTYTVGGGVSPCLLDTATVTVVVDPMANAGVFTAMPAVCNSAGTFDLFTLLDGTQQTGGVWTDSGNATVTNPVIISALVAGNYSFTYTVENTCDTDIETVQLEIIAAPVLTVANVAILSPICIGENATVTLSGLPDGTFDLFYELSGANVMAAQTTTVTTVGGTGTFAIPSSNLANPGTTNVNFTGIFDTVTNCTASLSNVQAMVVIRMASTLDSANLSVANICLGSAVAVNITGATGLPDGDYQFNFGIPNAIPATSTTAIITIAAGIGQFTVPSSFFPAAGSYTMTISGITSLSGGCTNLSEDAAVTFNVFAVPNPAGATVTAGDTCQNFQNTVAITNANNIPDGTYSIEYALSGANAGTVTININFAGGSGSFVIPATSLANAGSTTVTITQLTASVGLCGVNGASFNPVTFDVEALGTPVLLPLGNEFCEGDSPTVQTLSGNISGTETVTWYDAATGGTAIANTDLLINGATYYGAFTAASGCESPVRLAVTVDLTVCDDDIVIPDGFSPNNDNINDEFEIVNLPELYPKFKIEIYNRYGNILYKGNINTPNWNGTASEGGIKLGNEVVPVGVYFFILEFNDGTRKPVQGRVYLSR